MENKIQFIIQENERLNDQLAQKQQEIQKM